VAVPAKQVSRSHRGVGYAKLSERTRSFVLFLIPGALDFDDGSLHHSAARTCALELLGGYLRCWRAPLHHSESAFTFCTSQNLLSPFAPVRICIHLLHQSESAFILHQAGLVAPAPAAWH